MEVKLTSMFIPFIPLHCCTIVIHLSCLLCNAIGSCMSLLSEVWDSCFVEVELAWKSEDDRLEASALHSVEWDVS